jgi:TonB family protein
VALLGGAAWAQLYFLRRASAASRSRMCSLALIAILLLAAGEAFAPAGLLKMPIKAPGVTFLAASAHGTATSQAATQTGWWLALVWAAGAAVMLSRAIAGRVGLGILRGRSTPFARESRINTRTAEVQTPILCGLLRPVILLPEEAAEWTDEQLRMVVTHELTHFRQGDVWTNLLAQTVRALLWFHPVAWLLASRLSQEQELTCDEAVVASGHSRHDYASFLLDAARNLRSTEMFVCAMAGSGGESLKRRFANLLDSRPRPVVTQRIVAALASFAVAMVLLASVQPVWSQNQGKVYKVGNGVQQPKVLSKVDPVYTQEAKDAKIEGSVILSAVITTEGKADQIEVIRSLDAGLDQNAIDAVEQWTFQPGTKDGEPVAVQATIEVHYRLQ